jgi:predicted ATPase
MFLTKLNVKNFLSVNGECELPIDPRVTVLLGANDHGKSNLLRALEHLNFDAPLRVDDENWDSKGVRLDFVFQMTDQELTRLAEIQAVFSDEYTRLLEEEREELAKKAGEETGNHAGLDDEPEEEADDDESIPTQAARTATSLPISVGAKIVQGPPPKVPAVLRTAPASAVDDNEDDVEDEDEDEDEVPVEQVTSADILEDLTFLKQVSQSPFLTLTRQGVDADLSVAGRSLTDLPEEILVIFREMTPRVELFKAFSGELQDSVNAGEIRTRESEFMQGIFFYAGLDPLNCSELFRQDDETDKTLEVASVRLDAELRRLWAQGVDLDLHFQLKHRGNSIELLASDPAVKKRHARMSKQSSGVTQFFRLSMVLHARRQKNPANAYIYVFDEPGVFLHPKGQKDLLAVFEQLAADTQIIYATHSLFMLNQNYPERHRLITKNKHTTLVDSKPYRANWRYAVDALGVRLTANILFSPNILLVEGDSDPIYLYELFRVLNHTGDVDADANLIGIMSYSDLPNLRFLLQTFKAEDKERMLGVLFDGDSQGKSYLKSISNLCKVLEAKTLSLETGSAIEDYCLYPELFLRAAETTLRSSFDATQKNAPSNLKDLVKQSWDEFTISKAATNQPRPRRPAEGGSQDQVKAKPNPTTPADSDDRHEKNAGSWFKELSTDLIGPEGSSKVALARNYAFLSRENPIKDGLDVKKISKAKAIIEQVITGLNLPSLKAKKAIEA